ncbi:snake venom vascular endothelial growth factor toxin [Clarias gariepinus]|uniref:snake venom vascular endothelial growth factor toxin n=1 Tax=Clarias gariepinus TaxID=13013 RepID=UPI00234CF1E0|nr:snake venom vascular endothelial growth factor toxin [Clarias gariepinus]
MSQVWLCLLLLVTLSLQIPEVNLKNSRKDAQKKPTSNGDPETILLEDTVNKSSCQPRETLVKVYDEFSEQEQYHFRPDCVSVKRCSGCCLNEETKCMPEHTSTVEFEV